MEACLQLFLELQADSIVLLAQGSSPSERRALMRLNSQGGQNGVPPLTLILREYDSIMQAFEIVGNYLAADTFLLAAATGNLAAGGAVKVVEAFNKGNGDIDAVVGCYNNSDEEMEKYVFCMKPIVIASLQAFKQKKGLFGDESRTDATVEEFIKRMEQDGLKVKRINITEIVE